MKIMKIKIMETFDKIISQEDKKKKPKKQIHSAGKIH